MSRTASPKALLLRPLVSGLIITALMVAASGLPEVVAPAWAAAAKPAPVLAISNTSPRVGEVVTISNTGTCDFGSCNDNLKWFPIPMAGSHFGTQIGTFMFPATAVPYSWGSPGYKQIILTSSDGQSRLCCSGSTSFVITVLPTTPAAPTMISAAPGNASARVAFAAPSSDGGSAVTGYTVTASPSGASASGATSPVTVSGLSNGTAYTFTVHAMNVAGSSGESAASNAVTPVPVSDPPIIGSATGGNASASVAFSVPLSDGGSAITGYTVTASPGGASVSGATSPITLSGLSNGTAYTFTVHATNGAGDSFESAASNAVTPATTPDAPTIGSAAPGNTYAFVSFAAPSFDGGSKITGYTVTASPGAVSAPGTTSPITVGGLSNGIAYTFTVHATNAAGNSIESAASNTVTPVAPILPDIAVSDAKVTETNSPSVAVFTVSLSVPAGGPVSVNYSTSDSTAKAPGDYAATTGTISFAVGEQTKNVAVTVVGDSLYEVSERFFLNLSNPTGATITDDKGNGTIRNDDPAPSITISDVAKTEGLGGSSSMVFTVTLSAVSGAVTKVNFATADGTATAGSDYTAISGTVLIPAGATSKTFTVSITGDSVSEPDETLFVNLTSPVNATIADAQAVGTSTNDD